MLDKDPQQLTEDLLQCPICKDDFNNPKTLPCLHTFCESCLDRHLATSKTPRRLRCPVCRDPCNLPSNGISGLRSDFKVSKMAEWLKSVQENHGQVANCQICSVDDNEVDTRATHFCGSCPANLCGDCAKRHNENPHLKGHNASPTADAENALKCKIHPQSVAQHYCADCKVPVCGMCILTGHQGHTFVECQNLQCQKLESLQKPIESSIEKLQKALRELQQLEDGMATVCSQSKDCLAETKNQLLKDIEEKYNSALSGLDKTLTEKQASFREEKDKLTDGLAELNRVRDLAVGVLGDSENNAFYPGLQKLVVDSEAAAKRKSPEIPVFARCATQFKPNFEVKLGELVTVDLCEATLVADRKISAVQQPPKKKTMPAKAPTSAVSSKTVSKPATKPTFFQSVKRKLSTRNKRKCKCETCESKHCYCEERPRSNSERAPSSSPDYNRSRKRCTSEGTRTRTDSGRQLQEADIADLKKALHPHVQDAPLEPSAPPMDEDDDADVFEDSGVCDTSDSSDASDRDVPGTFCDRDEMVSSIEDLTMIAFDDEPRQEPKAKPVPSPSELCTSDQCPPPCINADEPLTQTAMPRPVTQINYRKKQRPTSDSSSLSSSPSSSSTSSAQSSASSSRSSSSSSTPVMCRRRSGSNPLVPRLPFGNAYHRHSFTSSGRKTSSLSTILLTEVVNNLSRR